MTGGSAAKPKPTGAAAGAGSSVAGAFKATRYAFAAPAFGQVSWNAHEPAATYAAWVDGNNWRFRLESLALRVPVGVASGGNTNVSGADSAEVKKTTWQKVETDLRPAGGTPNRSPRTKYWAEDLTWKHEVFHFDEFNTFLKTSFITFENQIEGAGYTDAIQADDTQAKALARKEADMNSRMLAAWNQAKTNMSPGMEDRAYADGVAAYTARADAVKARAVTEAW